MKNILTLLLLLNALICFAQNANNNNYGKVVYERVLNFDGIPKAITFDLFFNPEFSVFVENKEGATEGVVMKPSSDDEFDLSFNVKFNGNKYIVLTDFNKDSIQSQVSLFKDGKEKTYIVGEKINKIKWSIKNEFKTIGSIEAQKAVGEFRGREYIAWFANSIPVKYGPWKLNGLPGLILNATDDSHQVMFGIESIDLFVGSDRMVKVDFKFNNKFEKIILAEYVKLKAQQVEEIKKLFMSKLPRGSKIKMSNSKPNSVEIEYEFEEAHED